MCTKEKQKTERQKVNNDSLLEDMSFGVIFYKTNLFKPDFSDFSKVSKYFFYKNDSLESQSPFLFQTLFAFLP